MTRYKFSVLFLVTDRKKSREVLDWWQQGLMKMVMSDIVQNLNSILPSQTITSVTRTFFLQATTV